MKKLTEICLFMSGYVGLGYAFPWELVKKVSYFSQIFMVFLIGFISQIFIQDVFHKYVLDVIFEAFFKQLPFDINS